ncbi:MAG: hypothetical protein WHV44_08440 [Anaerolineales bacterium]
MKNKLFTQLVLVSLVVAIALAAFPASALAASGRDDPQPGAGGERAGRIEKRLEVAFARMKLVYERQADMLARTDEITRKVEALIRLAARKGLDASAVEKALADFQSALPAAQSAHEQAGAIIAAHNGFDDTGKVTDAAAAGETLQALHGAFQSYRAALDGSGRALREAVRQFVAANRGSFKPGDLP